MRIARRLGMAAAILGGLALAAHSVWWWIAARAVEDGVQAWIVDQQARGVRIEHAGLSVGGWPLAIRASADRPVIERPGLSWSGERLTAEASPYDVSVITVSLPGTHRLRMSDAAGATSELTARAGGAGTVTLAGSGEPLATALTFTDLLLTPPAGGATPFRRLDVAASRPALPPASHQDTGLTVSLAASDITLTGGAAESLGATMQRATLALRVQGHPPPLHRTAIAAWSRDGGTVEIDAADLGWGPLNVALAGTLALDAGLQPTAAMSAEVRGAEQTLSAFQNRLRPNQVTAARTVLAMLSRPPEGGGPPVLRAPLTIQNGGVYVGPLKVAPMPHIPW